MAMTEEEKREIAMMTADILSKRNEPKISPDWRKLSDEIRDFIKSRTANTNKDGVGYMTIQNSIYMPIKYILGLKDVRQITADQVPTARKIFEFIRALKEENEWRRSLILSS